tara:strand:- start:74 stop:634 length:561 start_codon:yes stop_codon:yes gene_type:complete
MKTLKIVSALLFSALMIIACEKEQVDDNASNETQTISKKKSKSSIEKDGANFGDYEIYYLNEDSEEEVSVSLSMFKNFVRNQMELESTFTVEDVVVSVGTENHDAIYALIPGVGQCAVFIEADPSRPNVFAMGGKTCTCTGTNCNGCSLTVSGNICECSDCLWDEGSCVKEESATVGAAYSASSFM